MQTAEPSSLLASMVRVRANARCSLTLASTTLLEATSSGPGVETRTNFIKINIFSSFLILIEWSSSWHYCMISYVCIQLVADHCVRDVSQPSFYSSSGANSLYCYYSYCTRKRFENEGLNMTDQ